MWFDMGALGVLYLQHKFLALLNWRYQRKLLRKSALFDLVWLSFQSHLDGNSWFCTIYYKMVFYLWVKLSNPYIIYQSLNFYFKCNSKWVGLKIIVLMVLIGDFVWGGYVRPGAGESWRMIGRNDESSYQGTRAHFGPLS